MDSLFWHSTVVIVTLVTLDTVVTVETVVTVKVVTVVTIANYFFSSQTNICSQQKFKLRFFLTQKNSSFYTKKNSQKNKYQLN